MFCCQKSSLPLSAGSHCWRHKSFARQGWDVFLPRVFVICVAHHTADTSVIVCQFSTPSVTWSVLSYWDTDLQRVPVTRKDLRQHSFLKTCANNGIAIWLILATHLMAYDKIQSNTSHQKTDLVRCIWLNFGHNYNRFTALCLELLGWVSIRRNIHPLTPILIINHHLSASSICYNP